VIRALTRTFASCEALDLGEVFAAATDPACLEVDSLFHGDLEVRGTADISNVPLGWCIVVADGFFMHEEGILQALNAASKCGLVARRFLFALGNGGAEPSNEFSECVLGDVVEGQEGIDRGAGGDGISRLYAWQVVGGARAGSWFVSSRGVHVKEVLQ
jgi:hypothetical protein